MIKFKKDFYPNSKLWRGYFLIRNGVEVGYIVQTVDSKWTVFKTSAGVEVLSKHKTLKEVKVAYAHPLDCADCGDFSAIEST